jgi:hypothetical protein
MAETLDIKDLTRQSEPESTDPKYLAWKREKIEAAIKQLDAHPDNTVPLNKMLNKHLGSPFDDFLAEEGIRDEARAHAIKAPAF